MRFAIQWENALLSKHSHTAQSLELVEWLILVINETCGTNVGLMKRDQKLTHLKNV